jgi:tryptophan 2,3-dioxygenase
MAWERSCEDEPVESVSAEGARALTALATRRKLTRVEDALRHVTTVARIIGSKRGTGGVSYLRKMREVVLFPELWQLRTDL